MTLWLCFVTMNISCLADEAYSVEPISTVSSSQNLNQIQTLIQQAETFRANGHLTEAAKLYQQVRILAGESNLNSYAALATGLTGYVRFLQQDYVQAETLLTQALQQSIKSDWILQAAIHANHLGNFYAAKGNREKTQVFYQEAKLLAERSMDFALVARIRINQTRLANIDDPERAWIMLQELKQSLDTLEPSKEKTALILATSYQILELKPYPTIDQNKRKQLITELLKQALTLAKQFNQARQVSMSLGYLAGYEEKLGHVQLGLSLTDQAVAAIQRIDAKDLLLQWEWQRGRMLNALGNEDLALAAYRRSISHIEAIRGDIPVVYKNGRSSFRETLQPVYLGLADLLIRRADASPNTEAAQRLLREARDTVELIKKTELEDYFDNRCTIQTLPEVALESIAPKTAALYPILFQDRLELLVSLPDGIHHQSIAVTTDVVTDSARDFADKLRNFKKGHQQTAKRLHSWLIAPISDLLTQHQIDTLIYIPDGPLRLIPLAALYDGKRYVIDRYAVVTSPGLKLFDPNPLPRDNMLTLVAGLSRPIRDIVGSLRRLAIC